MYKIAIRMMVIFLSVVILSIGFTASTFAASNRLTTPQQRNIHSSTTQVAACSPGAFTNELFPGDTFNDGDGLTYATTCSGKSLGFGLEDDSLKVDIIN